MLEPFSDYEPVETEMIDVGDVVLRVRRLSRSRRASGAEVETPSGAP